MSEIRIKKVKLNKDARIVMEYEKLVNDAYDRYRFISSEEAMPSFYNALKALGIHATELCELPESYVKRIEMRSVTFTYKGDEDIMGATMSSVMHLDHSESVISLNTPHKPSIPYDPNATEPYGDKCLSEKCVEALWNLERECQSYIKGERSQIKLFDDAAERDDVDQIDNVEEDIPDDDTDFDPSKIINFPTPQVPAAHASF